IGNYAASLRFDHAHHDSDRLLLRIHAPGENFQDFVVRWNRGFGRGLGEPYPAQEEEGNESPLHDCFSSSSSASILRCRATAPLRFNQMITAQKGIRARAAPSDFHGFASVAMRPATITAMEGSKGAIYQRDTVSSASRWRVSSTR